MVIPDIKESSNAYYLNGKVMVGGETERITSE